ERMLGAFAAGQDTPSAIRTALDISAGDFDELFAGHVKAEFGELLGRLDTWREAQQQAHQHASEMQWQRAADAAERAIGLYPEYVDEGSAYLVKARAYEELGQSEATTAALREYHARGGHNPDALTQLASELVAAGQRDAAIDVF